MQKHLILLTLLLLSACTIQVDHPKEMTVQERLEQKIVTGSVKPVETAAETGVILPDEPVMGVIRNTGALAENLLENGALERGDPDAPITLLVFTEHHCTYCREFQEDHIPKLLHSYGRNGQLKIQQMILPLEKYEGSRAFAAALICAARQGAAKMHGLLFGQTESSTDALVSYAGEFNLDTTAFRTCLTSDTTNALLDQQQAYAESLDVTLVPTLFLNGEKMVGLPYYPDLRGRIEVILEK